MSQLTAEVMRRELPKDQALEWEVLGFCLSVKDPMVKLHDSEIVPEDFAYPLNEKIFSILRDQLKRSSRADAVAIARALSGDPDFKESGGRDFLSMLREKYQGERRAIQAASHVKDLSRRRTLCAGLTESLFTALDMKSPLQDSLSSAYTALASTASHSEAKKVVGQREVLDGVYEDICRLMDGDTGPMGLPTGFSSIDMRTSGFVPGEYYIVAGRPGTGKTAFAINCAAHLAWAGHPVMFFSLEMPRDQIIKRLLSYTLGIDSRRFRGIGRWTEEEKARFHSRRMDEVYKMPLHYYDFSRIRASELRTLIHIGKERMGIEFVVVDYIGLVKSDGKHKARHHEVAEISGAIREAAKDLKIPVLALCQMNRNIEQGKREPQLSDLRESGDIEQDADVVMFLYADPDGQDFGDEEERIILKLAKNRHGPEGKIPLHFRKSVLHFSEVRDHQTYHAGDDGRHWQDGQ